MEGVVCDKQGDYRSEGCMGFSRMIQSGFDNTVVGWMMGLARVCMIPYLAGTARV